MTSSANVRATAAKIITLVVREKKSLTDLLRHPTGQLTDHDLSLLKQFCYGVLRWLPRLQAIADTLLQKPIKAKEQEVAVLIYLGLYQLIYLRIPSYAAVSETVSAAHFLTKDWAKSLINGVLRRFLKSPENFLLQADQLQTGHYAHPQWLIDAMQAEWPDNWQEILTANNEPAPLFLRVNRLVFATEQYQAVLQEQKMTAVHDPSWPGPALYLPAAVPVDNLPGFHEGACSVQDLAGQFIAQFLHLRAGQRVLDACAAPGGKTTHILECQPDLELLTAIDHDALRLKWVEENIRRLKLPLKKVRLIAAAAEEVAAWWDGQAFDRILLDAPCSGLGVIRRHPDIKILRQSSDIKIYQEKQSALLRALWPLLKPEGRLLYTTCSILPQENRFILEQFCQEHPDAKPLPIHIDLGIQQSVGRQLFPKINSHDGFYYGLLLKTHGMM
ncbi:MAG: 16S rRNA (cytosine(967)-C(5))-methyltransferase RsmB [Proteobacteria bacterium]|nr:16S rRNA (cytosine(967)-C(5))-methyltransferase RsmB [Pseudomonadota bacterium]